MMPSSKERPLEYSDLPPMTPGGIAPEGGVPTPPSTTAPQSTQPAAVNDDAPELDELDGPEDGADEPDDSDDISLDSAEGGDEGSLEQQIAALKDRLKAAEQRAEQAAQYEQVWAETQRVQQQQQAEAYWTNAQNEAEHWFREREKAIYREAGDAIAPAAFIEQQMSTLNGQRVEWYQKFHAQREQSFWEFAMQQALPNYVRDVAAHYNLSQDVIPELMEYPVELIPREAEKMKARRDKEAALRRAATQARNRAKREDMIENGVFPGSGRSGNADVPLDSDEFYHSIPWQRGGYPAR